MIDWPNYVAQEAAFRNAPALALPVTAQLMIETGNFKKVTGNNPGNIKYIGQADAVGYHEKLDDCRDDDGNRKKCQFASYGTPEDGINAVFNLLMETYDVTPGDDIYMFVAKLEGSNSSGYSWATSRDYGDLILQKFLKLKKHNPAFNPPTSASFESPIHFPMSWTVDWAQVSMVAGLLASAITLWYYAKSRFGRSHADRRL